MATGWSEWQRLLRQADPDPLEILKAAGKYQRYFAAVEERAVRAARAQGRTWDEIGQAVGTTRQAVWQRWRALQVVEQAVRGGRRFRILGDLPDVG